MILALLVLAQVAEPPTPAAALIARTVETEWVDEVLDEGRYVRFGTKDAGPVHVWKPRAYRKESAGVVVYLHGFFTDVDAAVREHRLITKFRDSARNAVFVVPQTRSWRTDALYWPKLDELITAVEKRSKINAGGSVIVLAHSGGYRNVVEWLADERVKTVVLIDGMYGNEKELSAWLELPGHQLVLVGYDTQQRIDWFVKKNPAVELETLPFMYDPMPAKAKGAKVISLHSERFDHMGLVENEKLIPWLLHNL